jgi:L-alanine-DL-glutamate epimerase-like enolase superfamily enzyme
MKIQTIESIPVLYHVLREGWSEESKTGTKKYEIWPSTMPAVLIKIITADGQMGVGEAMAMHWYLGNTQVHNYKLLQLYGKQLKGEDPRNLERIHKTLVSIAGRGAPSARAADDAVDMALLDLLGKAWGEPVYNLLGGAHHLKIPINPNLYLGTPEQMAEQAKKCVKLGYRALKIKCGMDIEENGWSLETVAWDIKKLVRTLEEVPETVLIDADSNQSWGNYKRAISIVKTFGLEKYLNLGIEQPVQYMDIEGASKIARAIGLPLILDESIFSPESLLDVIRRNAADKIVIKTARVGGIYVARKMIAMAETAGIDVAIDGLPYSKIGDTAMSHLAATIREPYPGDLETHTWLKENPVKSGGLVVEDGYAKVPSSPGLGIELDETAIEEMRTKIDL